MKYFIYAKACWTEGCEHPSGGRPDIDTRESREFSVIFEEDSAQSARREADRRLNEFKKSLPKKHDGSLHWSTEPEIVWTVFAKVLQLS